MDLLGALTTFIRVAESGSFSAVARQSNSSHSAIMRSIDQLESHFGIRLFQRTTRRLSLTGDGGDLLAYARRLIEAADEMEGALGRQAASPSGVVRLGVPVAAMRWLVPRLPELLNRHPGLTVKLVVSDGFGDLIEEQLDVALIGWEPPESTMIARAVGTFGRLAVASPAYLERNGVPAHPRDLLHHTCIVHDRTAESARWVFYTPEGEIDVPVSGGIRADNSEAVRLAALAGYGIALLSELIVVDDIRTDRLRPVLRDFASQRLKIHLVYPSRRHLPPRVRVVIDFLAEGVRYLNAHLAEHSAETAPV
ncbi:MAG TPA: LysR family transcriptional regulator [Acetobacteraceae bacterium]|nr:LysR family transcriptional regulator [Acetobacteraceae bacterium]